MLAATAAIFLLYQGAHPCDDAYIHFRHVKNFLENGRLAWNLSGNPTLGSTSPVFLIVLSFFTKISGMDNVAEASLVLNSFLLFLIILLMFPVLKTFFRDSFSSFLATVLIAFNSTNIYVFSQGFENALLILAIFICLFSVQFNFHRIAAVVCTIAPLIRPEGVLITAVVLFYIYSHKKMNSKIIIILLIVPAIWGLCSTSYYGSPVPHPITAKKMFPSIYQPYDKGTVNLLDQFLHIIPNSTDLWQDQVKGIITNNTLGKVTGGFLSEARTYFLILSVILMAITLVRHRHKPGILLFLYSPLFMLTYAWIGHTQSWYYPSFLTITLIFIFFSYHTLIDYTINVDYSRFIDKRKLRIILKLLIFAVIFSGNQYSLVSGSGFLKAADPRGKRWETWEAERYTSYRKAAELLNNFAGSTDVAIMSEVGVFGYYYDGEVFDSVGLCSPDALKFYPPPANDVYNEQGKYITSANNFIPTNMVMKIKPRFVVSSTLYILNLLRKNSLFLKEYRHIASTGTAWGKPVLVFERIAGSNQ